MAEGGEDLMDLDLNLGPVPPLSSMLVSGIETSSMQAVDFNRWDTDINDTIREAIRHRTTRSRGRWRQRIHDHIRRTVATQSHSLHLGGYSGDNGHSSGSGLVAEVGGLTLLEGEGSVPAEERSHEPVKTCEHNVTLMENALDEGKEDVEKSSSEEGSYFDCNICLALAREPVVTCCGHLFCWSCIYRWLHAYSDAKECPVCKGEVTLKTVTPIYGRGNNVREAEEDTGIKVPARPSARRIESLRQTIQRTASSFPMEEMIRRLGARFELTRDFFQLPDADGNRDALERSSLLNRILTSRALRREQNQNTVVPPDEVVDLTQDSPETVRQRVLPPLTYRRGQSHRGGSSHSSLAADRTATDRIVETYLRRSSPARSQEPQPQPPPPPADDRDSFSSIAAVIHGESQTVDTAVEIDSMVSLSTSSSRRRRDSSRASDVDSGDSRTLRRRRLN